MRIGIVTFHRAFNCGAALQAWALKRVLENAGHTVSFPACNKIGYSPRYLVQAIPCKCCGIGWLKEFAKRLLLDLIGRRSRTVAAAAYESFQRRELRECKCAESGFQRNFDCLVFGSDQIWNPAITELKWEYFLGATLPVGLPKIAYAASQGEYLFSRDESIRFQQAMGNFKAISVREPAVVASLPKELQGKSRTVLDPTLLLESNDYDAIAEGAVPSKPYLYAYTLAPSEALISYIKQIGDALGVQVLITAVAMPPQGCERQDVDYNVYPGRMVKLIKNAQYVLAASFHGTAISILYRKRFLYVGEQGKMSVRLKNILSATGLMSRSCEAGDPIGETVQKVSDSLPATVDRTLDILRRDSQTWLRAALCKEVPL